MKAGIALGMLATRALFALAPPADARVVMLWTTDEETGSRTSRALLETEARQSDAVLVLEPALPGGVLKTSRKGCGEYEIVVHGEPRTPASIRARASARSASWRARSSPSKRCRISTRGVSVNVGVDRAAARARTSSPPEARAIDRRRARRRSADAERIDAALRALTPHLPGATHRSQRRVRAPADGTHRGRRAALRAGAGGRARARSDDRRRRDGRRVRRQFCAALGVPTLDGLGALGDGAHALHEHVLVSALVPRAALHCRALAARRLDTVTPR